MWRSTAKECKCKKLFKIKIILTVGFPLQQEHNYDAHTFQKNFVSYVVLLMSSTFFNILCFAFGYFFLFSKYYCNISIYFHFYYFYILTYPLNYIRVPCFKTHECCFLMLCPGFLEFSTSLTLLLKKSSRILHLINTDTLQFYFFFLLNISNVVDYHFETYFNLYFFYFIYILSSKD